MRNKLKLWCVIHQLTKLKNLAVCHLNPHLQITKKAFLWHFGTGWPWKKWRLKLARIEWQLFFLKIADICRPRFRPEDKGRPETFLAWMLESLWTYVSLKDFNFEHQLHENKILLRSFEEPSQQTWIEWIRSTWVTILKHGMTHRRSFVWWLLLSAKAVFQPPSCPMEKRRHIAHLHRKPPKIRNRILVPLLK